MPAAFPALNNIESDGMLDIVNGLDTVLAKPQSHEIRARLEEDLPKQELGTPRLASAETDELPFLPSVRVDHAISIRVVEEHRQIAVAKTA
jgi:hypothetical protein